MGKAKPFDIPGREVWEAFKRIGAALRISARPSATMVNTAMARATMTRAVPIFTQPASITALVSASRVEAAPRRERSGGSGRWSPPPPMPLE